MIRRAPACCCTLAVLLAGALPAATASVNITHQCNNKFFQYEEGHPIGGNAWTYDIPPEYIPGGTSPSNACTRLTADTRLAFTGAFDAYFRRLMASVAFGTAENTNVTVGVWGGTVWPVSLQTAADWCSDAAITNIFNGSTNAWYLAANRVYAVTNAAVVVSNWVGYATNVVYVSGKPRVKVTNRYDVTTTNALDTTRILRRYLRDHNAMRVKVDNSIRGMMVSTGVDDLSLPVPSPWPDRRDFNLGRSASAYQEPVQIRTDDFLGWTFSAVAGPYLAPSAEWQQSLIELFRTAFQSYGGSFAYFFPTTWDLFGAQNSRDAIARDLRDNAGIKYLEYPDVCPEEWADFCQYMTGGGITDGYAAMTNLVGITFTTNTADGLSFLPSEPLTNSVRIAWAPWAGTDAYLALCDTSIAGNRAMPRLRYDVESTGGVATVTYRGKAGNNWLVFHTYGVYNQFGGIDRVYEVTNDLFELVRDGDATIVDGYGSRETLEERIELAKFDVGNGVTYTVYAESQVEDSGDPQYGRNYIQDPISDAKTWINNYLRDTQYMPNDGDTFYTFYWDGDEYTMPYFAMGGPVGVSYNVRPYYADYYIQIRATNVVCTVSKQVDQTTTLRAMPFDYRLASTSNSIPCLYPNQIYIEPSRGVDEIDGIYPAAISAIGVSTNDVDAYFMPDTNGYYFALHSDSGLANAKRVDDFWLDQDDALADKMGEEVADRAGANPRAPGGVLEAFAAYFDSLLTGEFNYYFAKLLRAHMAEEGVASGITFQGNWLPDMFQISNVRPSTDPGSLWDFDVTAMEWNEQTSSYEPISPQPQYIRHQWHFGLLDNIHTNVALGFHPAAARGRLSGLEAVKWNFHSMHDARATQSSAHLRVLPGGAPAADSPTTQPPNR